MNNNWAIFLCSAFFQKKAGKLNFLHKNCVVINMSNYDLISHGLQEIQHGDLLQQQCMKRVVKILTEIEPIKSQLLLI